MHRERSMYRESSQKLLAIALFVAAAVTIGDRVGVAQSSPQATVNIIRNASLWQDVWPGDFNGDGITDLAGSEKPNFMGGTGRVLAVIGNGGGGFSAPIATSFVGHVLAAADFNADSRIDLVVATERHTAVSILPGNGNGTFGSARLVETLQDVTFAVSADFDGDGKRDLVVGAQPTLARVYPGKGDFTFGTPVSLTTNEWPHDAIVTDLNGDEKLDLAVANHYRFTISIFLNQGALLFTGADVTVGGPANDVTAGDLNGDGKTDLVVATENGGLLDLFSDEGHAEVLLGHGDGTSIYRFVTKSHQAPGRPSSETLRATASSISPPPIVHRSSATTARTRSGPGTRSRCCPARETGRSVPPSPSPLAARVAIRATASSETR
jgi:VCBS repeat protein/FG-GAP repeat protein